MRIGNSPWFLQFKRPHSARLRLFCFPYAGGNANIFESWGSALEGVDVVGIQLPGRSYRFTERPLESIESIVEQLIPELATLGDLPFAFFGHSNGSLICFELARELQRRGVVGPKHIFLSAKRAPHLPRLRSKTYDLPLDEFLEALRGINGTPEAVLRNKELMDLYVPILRCDFKISETHIYNDDVKLRTSASLFTGLQDTDVCEGGMLAWRANIESDDIQYATFPGDHFFIHSQKPLVLAAIREALNRLLHTHAARDTYELSS